MWGNSTAGVVAVECHSHTFPWKEKKRKNKKTNKSPVAMVQTDDLKLYGQPKLMVLFFTHISVLSGPQHDNKLAKNRCSLWMRGVGAAVSAGWASVVVGMVVNEGQRASGLGWALHRHSILSLCPLYRLDS